MSTVVAKMAFLLSVVATGLAVPATANAQGWTYGARMARYYYGRTPTYQQAQPVQYVYQQPAQTGYQTMRPAYNNYTYQQPAYNTVQQASYNTQPAANYNYNTAQSYGDAYGFTAWLNGVRAQYGLSAVSYDSNLENWAQQNNAQQAARGLGHFVMGPARRQNAAIGSAATIGSQWMNSPAHRAGLLDPSITRVGLAGNGSYWTWNAY